MTTNNEEEPDFYEEEENDEGKNENNYNCSFNDEIEKEKKENDLAITMINNDKYKLKENKIKENENEILKNIDNEEEKKINNDSEEEEPNFYDEEQNGIDKDEEEEEKENEDNNDEYNNYEEKEKERNNKRKEELKKKNIDIKNIYEINKDFNYNIDNPVFYLKEDKNVLDKYPWPLSTKQIESIIEKNNIPYEKLKVKLVDLFEFKLKNAFEFVDFIEVIKPEWASNVTYSKIFLDLHNFKMNKEKEKKEDNNINKEENKIQKLPSIIHKLNETKTFSEEKKILNIIENKKEELKDEKKNNFWPKNKNKKGKKQKGTEIKGGFIFD